MNSRFLLLVVLAFSSGCMRLDDNLYNLGEKITEYKRDAYTGVQDFILPDSYRIPDSLIYEFTLASKYPGETQPTKIYATYIGHLSRIPVDTVIMYCQGNKWHMDFYWQRAKLIANTGGKNRFGVLMLDYRGYGLSEGKPTEEGLYADVGAGLDWLAARGLADERLVMYGFSMGSAPATKLTADPHTLKPSALVLEAPFASADVMVQDASGIAMPGSFVTNLKINNAEEIKKVTCPFLWMHGTKDDFLNIQTHGEVVFKNYHGTQGVSYRVEGAGHGSVPQTMGFDAYEKALLYFITM